MSDYITTIGLEIHAELKTKTKMFCDSKNDPDEARPNANICPTCMGHPGTLPVINKEAVKHVIKVGVALGGTIADFTEFDRKNYFYPDIPKGYQLSQYEFPLVTGGVLRGVAITRVHLEEDTATSLHRDASDSPFPKGSTALPSCPRRGVESARRGGGSGGEGFKSSILARTNFAEQNLRGRADSDTSLPRRQTGFKKGGIKVGDEGGFSLVDFNRAGVPLMELVTEPMIKSAKEAGDFARELQLVLRYLHVSDANMEKGEMRVEANISIARATETADLRRTNADQRGNSEDTFLRQSAWSPRPSAPLGTKVEVKNLNSFRAVERAIAYEVARHRELLEAGEKVTQETRGWNEDTQKTFVQRRKEESHDYRYFPDPDLPKLQISKIPEFREDALRKEMPELPEDKRARYAKEFGIKPEDIELFVNEPVYANYFEKVAQALDSKPPLVKLASNYILSDLVGLAKEGGWKEDAVGAVVLADIIKLIEAGELSSRGAKELIALYYHRGVEFLGKNPKEVAIDNGLVQKSNDDELKRVAEALFAEHPKVVADYHAGKTASLQFLVGQGMKVTKGSANPGKLRTIIEALLRACS